MSGWIYWRYGEAAVTPTSVRVWYHPTPDKMGFGVSGCAWSFFWDTYD